MSNVVRALFARNARRTRKAAAIIAGCTLLAVFAGGANAQDSRAPEGEGTPVLALELNALQPSERGCRFTFVASNQLGGEVSQVAFELALFTKAGMITRLTIVDFKDLPDGKTKVRQFDFPDVDCADVGRVLVNDATQCVGEGIEAGACIRSLTTQTGTDVTFGS